MPRDFKLCPTCHGLGKVPSNPDPRNPGEYVSCGGCGGSGWVPK